MTKWQYWKSSTMYTFFVIPIVAYLSVKHRLAPHNIIFTNPQFKYGGMEIDSKYDLHLPLQGSSNFLDQVLLKKDTSVKENSKKVLDFMKKRSLTFPIILKPEKGCVGFGVKKISSQEELENLLQKVPVNYLGQEYCDFPEEFGVMYRRFPNQKRGKITGITRKQIPWVCGDGKSSVKELIDREARYKYNKKSLFVRAKNLSYIPKINEEYQIIVQGSHTYGSIFTDVSSRNTKELEKKFDEISSSFKGFHLGRFDVKATSMDDFFNGKNIKVIELNGCMSEPTHMYDNKYPLNYGLKQIHKTYDDVFTIAKKNKKKLNRKASFKKLSLEFREFLKTKDKIMKQIG